MSAQPQGASATEAVSQGQGVSTFRVKNFVRNTIRASKGVFIIKYHDLFRGTAVFLKVTLDGLDIQNQKYALAMDSNVLQGINLENDIANISLEWYYNEHVMKFNLKSDRILSTPFTYSTNNSDLMIIILKNSAGEFLVNKKHATCFKVSNVSLGESVTLFKYSSEESNGMYSLDSYDGQVQEIIDFYFFINRCNSSNENLRGSIIINSNCELVGISMNIKAASLLEYFAIKSSSVKQIIEQNRPNLSEPEQDVNSGQAPQYSSEMSGISDRSSQHPTEPTND